MTIRSGVLIVVFLLTGFTGFITNANAQSLKVSSDGRYLQQSNGSPFIWIGDTAWELFHRLNREEATEYLQTRKRQGFSVIQAVVLAENDGLRVPNALGDLPLIDLSPEKPNEKYFSHVDFIVNKAGELGLYVGMLPTWGDKLYSLHPGAGPVVFNEKNAEMFGEYLGRRYRDKKIIWILGGDRNIDNPEVLDIWRAMARGLKKGDKGNHLISFHPRGGSSSSYWLHNEDWLDFNMYQSGHAQHYNPVYNWAENDLNKKPAKPVIDAEPAYEDIPVRFWEFCDFTTALKVPADVLHPGGLIKNKEYFKSGFFNDYDVRVHAYWNFLAGACGYTYGNNAVWQMYKKNGPIAIPCLTDWRDALNRPGASQIIHLKKFFEQRPVSRYLPDQSIIYGFNKTDSTHIRAALATDKKSAIIYLSVGQKVSVVLKKITDPFVRAAWFNPRTGEQKNISEFRNDTIHEFIPPTSGRGNDWLLLLDGK